MSTRKTNRLAGDALKLLLIGALAFGAPGAAHAAVHKAEKGETYYSISRKYGITVDELCAANNISSSDILRVGQSLTIPEKDASAEQEEKAPPAPEATGGTAELDAPAPKAEGEPSRERKFDTYTVQKGDTLYRIAKVNGITVDELKNLNDFGDDSVLKAGARLRIPATIVDAASVPLPSLPQSEPQKSKERKGDSSLVWPVKDPVVTYTSGKVSGVQLSAQKNEDVTAIRAGTVVYVGNYRGYGQVVFVQDKTSHIYVYSGLGSIKVQKGDYVVFGNSIGTAGTDGKNGADQICLMVFEKASPMDPAKAPRG